MNCVHCLLTRERRIQRINTCTLVAAATASTGGGGDSRIIRWGGRNGKDPSKQTGICNNFIKQKLGPYSSADHLARGGIIILSEGLGGGGGITEKTRNLLFFYSLEIPSKII